jgi:hypothetical protein
MAGECKGDEEFCPHASKAAEIAVRKVFAILGVDINVPKDIADFQQNLRFGANMRRAADKGILAVVGAFAVAIGAVLWVGVVTMLTSGPKH